MLTAEDARIPRFQIVVEALQGFGMQIDHVPRFVEAVGDVLLQLRRNREMVERIDRRPKRRREIVIAVSGEDFRFGS